MGVVWVWVFVCISHTLMLDDSKHLLRPHKLFEIFFFYLGAVASNMGGFCRRLFWERKGGRYALAKAIFVPL